MTDGIRLRPIVDADLPLLTRMYTNPVDASEFGFFGFRNPDHMRKAFETGFISEHGGKLAVVRDFEPGEAEQAADHGTSAAATGTVTMAGSGGGIRTATGDVVVGDVGWHRVTTGPSSATWNIGIGLMAKERGKGFGTRAQRLLVEYLFSYTQFHRIEAGTETTNLAEQRSLEKVGFTREGIIRGACFRAGRWRDMVSYSILRTDVEPAG
ncbi:MAG TPA: GNAT family protein [Actinocrinis sp.]|nr:GNAT family protein [Actinocrinis sp.]